MSIFEAAMPLARLAPRGVDIAIDALGGPLTGQAVGGLALDTAAKRRRSD